jgi:hypothetical protein
VLDDGMYIQDFAHYKSGVYKYTKGDYMGGHAVKLVGWGTEDGTDYWVRNVFHNLSMFIQRIFFNLYSFLEHFLMAVFELTCTARGKLMEYSLG